MAARIPFTEAISEPLLLKKRFEELSRPQRVALKAFYGLPLDAEELRYWAMFQEAGIFDDLGYLVDVKPVPYVPREYEVGTLVFGRRSGKTDTFSTTAIVYEAALGGHEDYVRKGAQQPVCFIVAQDTKFAKETLNSIRATLDSSPLLAKEVAGQTADSITLKNGVSIAVAPANTKAVRGYPIPAIAMDEVCVWYSDADAANPDVEIDRAIKFAQGQFPHRKKIITSTPWIKEGLLWQHYGYGTGGIKLPAPKRKPYRKYLLLHAPTAALENPLITRDWLSDERAKDPEAYEREMLAKFSDASSGFLNAALVREAVDVNVAERPPQKEPFYIAAMDPAFRKDAFAFTIVHSSAEGIVQDVVRRWKAEPGTSLNPAIILTEIAGILRHYRIPVVYSDQYQLESLQQLAIESGFAIEGVDFTAKSKARIFGSLQQLINTRRLKLLDPDLLPEAQEQLNELLILEKRLLPGGNVQISAPPSKHDDMAAVLALAAFKATWLMPATAVKENTVKEPTLFEKCMATVKRKKAMRYVEW